MTRQAVMVVHVPVKVRVPWEGGREFDHANGYKAALAALRELLEGGGYDAMVKRQRVFGEGLQVLHDSAYQYPLDFIECDEIIEG